MCSSSMRGSLREWHVDEAQQEVAVRLVQSLTRIECFMAWRKGTGNGLACLQVNPCSSLAAGRLCASSIVVCVVSYKSPSPGISFHWGTHEQIKVRNSRRGDGGRYGAH